MSSTGSKSRLSSHSPGQTMTEYALILVTVAAVLVALIQNAGTLVVSLVNNVGGLL